MLSHSHTKQHISFSFFAQLQILFARLLYARPIVVRYVCFSSSMSIRSLPLSFGYCCIYHFNDSTRNIDFDIGLHANIGAKMRRRPRSVEKQQQQRNCKRHATAHSNHYNVCVDVCHVIAFIIKSTSCLVEEKQIYNESLSETTRKKIPTDSHK